ncbi:MAG: hypothetical protein AB8B59_03550 [Maribacter sp.]
MKKTSFLLFILLGLLLIPISSNAQDKNINLDLLFWSWAINQDGSSEYLIIKKSTTVNRGSSYIYDFKISTDSIIYQDKILSKIGWCLTPPIQRDTLGYEVWTLDAAGAKLRYDIYFDSITNKKPADYSIIYKIQSLDKKYLKLRLDRELFEGQ